MTHKINPEVKAAWVAALRSGKYTQGRAALNYEGKMCCLGVLCDIKDPNLWMERVDGKKEYLGAAITQPPEISKWAGFPISEEGKFVIPSVVINEDYYRLWVHNDDGATFEEIATAIEEQL